MYPDEERTTRTGRPDGNGRRYGEPGNGSTSSEDAHPEDKGWVPVVGNRRPAPRPAAKPPAEQPAFRRIDNGSSRYSGPSQYDPMYSPVHYHFSRVQAHHANRPWNMWLAVLAMSGFALAFLLVVSLPGLLSHARSAAAESPSAVSSPSGSDAPVVIQTTPPPRIASPTPTVTPSPAPTYYKTYKVQAGDTTTKIANRFGLKTWELLLANPNLKAHPALLKVGLILNIPRPGQLTPAP